MTPEKLIPIVAALSFGIQQFTQVIVDPIASVVISIVKYSKYGGEQRADGTRGLRFGITDVDAKKTILGLSSFIIGLMIASTDMVRILKTSGVEGYEAWDVFITALTISAGTEGLNTVVKLAQYLKDVVKARTPPSVAQNSPAPRAT